MNTPSDYTVSIHYDRRLYRQDIAGSIAHARMLARQGIITSADADAIVSGLGEIRGEIESGSFPWRPELEDIHMNIERRLHEKIGAAEGSIALQIHDGGGIKVRWRNLRITDLVPLVDSGD